MSSNHKTPPFLSEAKNYQDWLKLIKILCNFSDLSKAKQGPAILLSLESKTLDAVLEFSEEVISGENGDVIITRLGRMYKKDETLENYMASENFETFKRPDNMKISDYFNKFEQLGNRASPMELKCQKTCHPIDYSNLPIYLRYTNNWLKEQLPILSSA